MLQTRSHVGISQVCRMWTIARDDFVYVPLRDYVGQVLDRVPGSRVRIKLLNGKVRTIGENAVCKLLPDMACVDLPLIPTCELWGVEKDSDPYVELVRRGQLGASEFHSLRTDKPFHVDKVRCVYTASGQRAVLYESVDAFAGAGDVYASCLLLLCYGVHMRKRRADGSSDGLSQD